MAIRLRFLLLIFIVIVMFPLTGNAFGVLTHEAIIDAAWDKSILPLLKKKYPSSTDEDLKLAHAYAYGGSVAPDMGYYPRGSKQFTDLVHYVRSGDMVNALLKNARNLNQFAFALGFLSHYDADKYGHPIATNRSVPLVYPKLKAEFGNVVTYDEDELSHMRMEFGFDVLQVAKGNYASQTYREGIGFKVDTAVLAKAFYEVYGLDIYEVHNNHFSQSVETFRWVVANIFPLLTRQAWATKKSLITELDSTATAARFNYKMKQRNYDKTYGTGYKRPGFFPSLVSYLIRVLPKLGPLKALKFKMPTAEAEKYFTQSFDTIMHYYIDNIARVSDQGIQLEDIDFDTGRPTAQCEYELADIAYSDLLIAWSAKNFVNMPATLKANITNHFAGVKPLASHGKYCGRFFNALEQIRRQ